MSTVQTIKEVYNTKKTEIGSQSGIANVMDIPSISKVIVNVGVGRITKDSEKMKEVHESIIAITGQEPLKTKAKKSIAGFKIREGQQVGVKVTLRGARMWDFLTRFVGGSLPRVRDFQGVTLSSIDAQGNLNIGIKEHTVFPEIVAEYTKHIFPLQVTIVPKTPSREAAEVMYRALGFPIIKKEDTTK